MFLISVLISYQARASIFVDEADCNAGKPAACLRMALRQMGEDKDVADALFQQTVEATNRDLSSLDDKEAPLVAAAIELGNQLSRKEFNGLIPAMEMGCKNNRPYMCFARAATLSRSSNTDKEKQQSKILAAKAFDLAIKECDAGKSFSCFFAFISGLLFDIKPNQVEKLYQKACEMNEPQACLGAAEVAMHKSDRENAIIKLKLSCDANYTYGCLELARVLRKAGQKDEAIAIAKKKCDDGPMPGLCFFAGWALAERKATAEQINLYYVKGCDLNNADSCFNLGIAAISKDDTVSARHYFTRACDLKNGDGCHENSKIESSLGNRKEKKRLLSRGCELNSANSCLNLAIDEGNTKAGLKTAMPLYRKANKILNRECSNGYNESCKKLKSLTDIASRFGLTFEEP